MKRNIKNRVNTLLAVFSVAVLFSCVNDVESIFEDNGSYGIVELFELPARSTSTAFSVKSTALEATDVAELPITVNYTGANGAPEDIAVTLKVDTQIIETYNNQDDDEENDYTALPSHLYGVDTYNIVIPKGEKKAVFTVNIYPPQYTEDDFFESYALGISIESASSGVVSGNYGKGVFPVAIKNKYDGIYEVDGTYEDYVNAAFSGIYPQEVHLVTLSGNIVEVQYVSFYSGNYPYYYFFNSGSGTSYFGNWSPVFSFDTSTDKATAVTNHYGQGTNSSLRAGEIDATADNYYDPATKSIYITYYLVQGGNRRGKFTEVYTYKGSR